MEDLETMLDGFSFEEKVIAMAKKSLELRKKFEKAKPCSEEEEVYENQFLRARDELIDFVKNWD